MEKSPTACNGMISRQGELLTGAEHHLSPTAASVWPKMVFRERLVKTNVLIQRDLGILHFNLRERATCQSEPD